MNKAIFVVFLIALAGCGGSSDSQENENPNNNPPPEDNSQEVAAAATLLGSLIGIKQDAFFSDFEDEQQSIARQVDVRSGSHLTRVRDQFELMLNIYIMDIENDILTVSSGGFLQSSAVQSELNATENATLDFIRDEVMPDYEDNFGFSGAFLFDISLEMQDNTIEAYTVLGLELQSRGVL